MKRIALVTVTAVTLFLMLKGTAISPVSAATPSASVISADSPTAAWSGRTWTAPNPLSCISVNGIDPTCDRFALTIVPPKTDFVVTIRVVAANATDQSPPTDDIDLYLLDPDGNTLASSGTPGGIEELVLNNPPAGTYTVLVQPFVVVPGGTYSGFAAIGSPPADRPSNAYNGVPFTSNFVGVPSSTPAKSTPLIADLKTSFNYVGRGAAEPTIGVNRDNKAFFAASMFDFPTSSFPERLARTLVMRSTDKGASWRAVSPSLTSSLPVDEETATFPPFSLDPYVYVDSKGLNPASRAGRVFSVDLNAACGANAIFSDDEGAHWTSVPLFACNSPVNDHQTIVTAPPPPGVATTYPSMVYFCYNQVAESNCSRSADGGLTFMTTTPAFTGTDPSAGSVCGGLTGHLAADSAGRIFLPKGHCGLPWVAVSSNAGNSWTRVKITNNTPMADHEVTLAVDTADNVYAVWQDGTFRLPFLSVSKDHGMTWSTPIMMAPPGVHEVNFPTIAAGDAGRIVVLFPGSESQDFTDPTRPWNMYVVVSVNALDANPTFTWTRANEKGDPVHRGDCGPGRCDAQDGGSMFDFLDVVVSPADGAFWGTASDTCVPDADPAKNCVTNPQAQQLRPGQGVAIRQIKGPALFANR